MRSLDQCHRQGMNLNALIAAQHAKGYIPLHSKKSFLRTMMSSMDTPALVMADIGYTLSRALAGEKVKVKDENIEILQFMVDKINTFEDIKVFIKRFLS